MPAVPIHRAAPEKGAGSTRTAPWIRAAVVLALGLVVCLRRPDSLLHAQLNAEDAFVFFMDGYRAPWSAIFRPYAGYLHLIPRLFAALEAGADPAVIPTLYAASAGLVWLGVAALCFNPRLKLPAGGALALILAFVPHTGEVLLSLTNIQWVAAFALVLWVAAEDPQTRAGRVWTCFGIAVSGLSGPFALILSPAFVLRALVRRTIASCWLAGTALTAGLIQFIEIKRTPADEFTRHPQAANLLRLFEVLSFRVFGTFLTGYGSTGKDGPSLLWLAIGVLAVAAAVLACCRARTTWATRLIIVCAGLLIVPVAAKYYLDYDALAPSVNGDRYFYLPHLLLGWLLLIAVQRAPSWGRGLALLLLVFGLTCNLPYFKAEPMPDLHWERYVPALRAGTGANVPINPGMMLPVPPKAGRAAPGTP